ncbi:MAG: hypothetical protein LBC77_09350 [Spirochaetaceae bacterium]|nr:hypothetical protein [Spirochaetaceae bacterium]
MPQNEARKRKPYWVFGEAFERSYAVQRRGKIDAHELPNKSIIYQENESE